MYFSAKGLGSIPNLAKNKQTNKKPTSAYRRDNIILYPFLYGGPDYFLYCA